MDVNKTADNMVDKAKAVMTVRNKEVQQRIWHHFENNQYDQAIHFIKSKLAFDPEDHWLLTRLGTAYYEKHEYQKALKFCKKALRIKPLCPLVLWDYAGTMSALGKKREAIKTWKKIANRGAERIAYDECGEGLPYAKSLINDCKYRIGLDYLHCKKEKKAKKYFTEYLINRKRKVRSIYLLRDAINYLKKIDGTH